MCGIQPGAYGGLAVGIANAAHNAFQRRDIAAPEGYGTGQHVPQNNAKANNVPSPACCLPTERRWRTMTFAAI